MREVAERLREVEIELASERGAFVLFGLFLRQDSPGRWDVVVAATWVEDDRTNALSLLAERIHQRLTPDQLTQISRVVPTSIGSPGLRALQRTVRVEHGLVEVQGSDFFGVRIERAFIITCIPGQEHRPAVSLGVPAMARRDVPWDVSPTGRSEYRATSDVPVRVYLLDESGMRKFRETGALVPLVFVAGSETRTSHTWQGLLHPGRYYFVIDNPGQTVANVSLWLEPFTRPRP